MSVNPEKVFEILKKRMLVDGFDIVIDMEKSQGSYIVDARDGKKYLDFYTFFGSSALGMNHPKLNNNEFKEKIFKPAINKVANSDIYTTYTSEFVDTFSRVAMPDYLPHLFLISGGALAVENALKVSFDWKVRKNFSRGIKEERGHKVIHFKDAFHGRSGYTISLTNTADPRKYMYFSKFDWPRVLNPKITFPLEEHIADVKKEEEESISQINEAIKKEGDDIAALIIEPIQCEGGDNFFRKEFFQELRKICDENEIMLVFDEVQTGCGITGKMWAHEYYVKPDILCFGKKFQVCGIIASKRVDEVEKNCFQESSRINSTWGGNIVDMVRVTRILEVIEEEKLVENVRRQGELLLKTLYDVQKDFPDMISNVRGLGLLCSFDMPDTGTRDEFRKRCLEKRMIVLPCGKKTIRFRPILCVEEEQIGEADEKMKTVLNQMKK
ncbi:MAG: L-lysine 6-transaminase [Methanomicrobia archaeon]|nr:L-lysine 6-transaminase [Methanomicrobia archaeon]